MRGKGGRGQCRGKGGRGSAGKGEGASAGGRGEGQCRGKGEGPVRGKGVKGRVQGRQVWRTSALNLALAFLKENVCSTGNQEKNQK